MNPEELIQWWLNLSDTMGGRSELDSEHTVNAIRGTLLPDELADVSANDMLKRMRLAANYAVSVLERELGDSLNDIVLVAIARSQVEFAETHSVFECFAEARRFAEGGPGEDCPHQWLSTIGALCAAALRSEEVGTAAFEAEIESALEGVAVRGVEETADFGEAEE